MTKKNNKFIVETIIDCFIESPAQQAARILYVHGWRESDFDYKFLSKYIKDEQRISVQNELRDLEIIKKT